MDLRFGGRPTTGDVKDLWDAFGVPVDPISYEAVGAVIHEKPRSNRFRTVTTAWRKMLQRDHNVEVRAESGSFRAMAPGERVEFAGKKIKSGLRQVRRADVIVGTTDREKLSPQDRRKAEHLQLVTSALIHTARTEAKQFQARLPKPSSE